MASSNSFVGVVPDDIMKQRQPKELVLNGNRELGGVLDCFHNDRGNSDRAAAKEPMKNAEIKISAMVVHSTELSFNYKVSSAIALDLCCTVRFRRSLPSSKQQDWNI
ncbi:hypothetical protein V6N12_053666 [Hibiscus sabdariffa]|uniref:Uncharacterized protein n=1 Tax=Hibiscus sabdariffa TaxID=183260 RepID=A0ABR2D892_9ROSI